MHKRLGYLLKCEKHFYFAPVNYYKMVQTYQIHGENDFPDFVTKMKYIFMKKADFPAKLDALHRTEGQNVVNASLAQWKGFFYTFIQKV